MADRNDSLGKPRRPDRQNDPDLNQDDLDESESGMSVQHETEIVKRCECGARYDIGAWKGLTFMGLQDMEDGDLFLELRDCACCESTISLAVHVAEAESWISPSLRPSSMEQHVGRSHLRRRLGNALALGR